MTGLRKNVFFICPFHLPFPCTKIALKNALLLGIFQSAKTSNLRVLLNKSKNTLLGNVLTPFPCNCDTEHTCQRPFLIRPSRLSMRVMWICQSFRSKFIAGAAIKPQFYFLLDFSKSKSFWKSFSLIFENSSPKGFSCKIWRNPWFEFWNSILNYFLRSNLGLNKILTEQFCCHFISQRSCSSQD